jgi:choline dehydrogenase-like flavoprotein
VADHFDVIIVGTGAGGGTLAHTLAPTGKRILLLERGTYLPREMDDWNPKPVFVDGKYISADTWYDGDGTPFQPQVHYFVGGATKMYGAALYRLRPEDFGEIQHVDGVSPAWPVSYADFEPWYTRAEWLYQVHGAHGEDPTEGPSSRQYPWPAVSHEPRIQQISDTLVQAGYDPFHAPCGILLDEADRPASTCIRCATCDGYPCLVHAKSDAEIIAVRPVLGLPNVTLMVNSEVVRLETDPSGRTVAGVVVDHGGDGKEDVYTGDIVVLAAGAANTARILLRSASDTHPAGLANGSDQVGRNYMFHNSKAIAGFGAEPNDTVFQKTLGLNDFYLAGDGRQWPLGNVQMLGKSNEGAMKGEEPHLTKLVPGWSLEEAARHAVDFWLTTEDLPRPGNRVTIDRDGAIHLSYADSNQAEAAGLYEEFRKVLNHIGLARHHVLHKNFYMSMNIPLAGCAHQAGTCRFGADPATSVVDLNCKAHELDNLYVADTSIFPSIGAVNPALTAIANGIRVGEHIAERLGASTGTAWAPAQRTKPAQGTQSAQGTQPAQRTQSAQGTQPTSHPASAIGGGDLPADHSAGPRRSDRNSPSSSTARRCPRSEPASRSTISPVRTACISVAYARTSSFISVPSGSALRISSSTIRRTGIR